jgi:hypothetical protein
MKTPNPTSQKNKRNTLSICVIIVFAITLLFSNVSIVKAEPAGSVISSNITETSQASIPGNRSDEGGTITTLTLDALQQDSNWKAYVGNVSGSLTLDDSNGFTIYRWALGASEITGELYVSKSSAVAWSLLNCSEQALIDTEDTTIGFTGISADSINKTFNQTTHPNIVVAGRTIPQNTCRSTSTYVNDTPQAIATADFPEVILASSTDVVFMSPLNQGSSSFATAMLADFQIIVPDDVTTAVTRYYFYVEIGS